MIVPEQNQCPTWYKFATLLHVHMSLLKLCYCVHWHQVCF